MNVFPGRIAVQQRVLPAYRAPFFERLAQQCEGGVALLTGQPLPLEGIAPRDRLTRVRLTNARNLHLFHPRHPLFVCWQAGLTGWLESEQPDVLIVEANPRYLSTRRLIAGMRERGKPVLGWGLGAPPLTGPLAVLRARARRKLLASLDGVIAYSQRGRREYAKEGVLPEKRLFVAANAVSPPPAPAETQEAVFTHEGAAPAEEAAPPDRGARPSRLQLLFVGRLQARKRLDLLFEACAALPPEKQPGVTIVGDGPARGEFETLAARIYPGATFSGALHGNALREKFTGADLFILPGTGGLAVQEAMSHGLPVIVTQGDGTQEDLVRPENGWLIPAGDLGALGAALRHAISDPALRSKGEESRRIVAEEINLHTMVDQFIAAALEVWGRS